MITRFRSCIDPEGLFAGKPAPTLVLCSPQTHVGASLLAKGPEQTRQEHRPKKSPASLNAGLFHSTPDQAAGSSSALTVAVTGTTACPLRARSSSSRLATAYMA